MKYEYKVLWNDYPFGGSKELVMRDLNALGARGWVLCARYADTMYFVRLINQKDKTHELGGG